MNMTEAFYNCHEIMLLAPGYVARENAKHTYILVQITDTPKTVHTSCFLIDPSIPESGGINEFADMQLQQQVAILALPRLGDTATRTHQDYEKAMTEKEPKPLIEWLLRQLKGTRRE